ENIPVLMSYETRSQLDQNWGAPQVLYQPLNFFSARFGIGRITRPRLTLCDESFVSMQYYWASSIDVHPNESPASQNGRPRASDHANKQSQFDPLFAKSLKRLDV